MVEELSQIVAAALRILNPEGEVLPSALETAAGEGAEPLETIETSFPGARHIPTTPQV